MALAGNDSEASNTNTKMNDDDGSSDDEYSTGSFEIYREIYHPLYTKYQETQGTQDNLLERRAYLLEEQARLEKQARLKKQTLLPDEEKSLDELDKDILQVDAEIKEYGIEIERLRVLCLEQGIIDKYNNYIGDDHEGSNANASEDSEDSSSSRPPRSPSPLPPLPCKPQVRILPPQTT
jgi:hypothetical protein